MQQHKNWDSIKMAQRFLSRANALHPEEEQDDESYEQTLALQELSYECYMNSFSYQKIVQFLHDAINGSIKYPKNVDQKKYLEAYIKHAKAILNEVE